MNYLLIVQFHPVLKSRQETSALIDPQGFREAIVDWFSQHGLDHPWRRTREPYEILVSEVMLQQTQVKTVLQKRYYERFLEAFPDAESLAKSEDPALLKAWEGLGYYRRARMLRDTAQAVVANHGGVFPRELGELMALPGVGRYTAGALRAFAFREPAVVVDGNVIRVLSRLMDFREPTDDSAGLKKMWQWAGQLADSDRPAAYHAGLMELGQVKCRPGIPDCLDCPVAGFCATRDPGLLPMKKRKTKVTPVDEHALWLRDSEGRLLLLHERGARRTGLWKLPLRDAESLEALEVIAEERYAITRYRVRMRVHDGGVASGEIALSAGESWCDEEDIEELALAAPFRRVIERLLSDP